MPRSGPAREFAADQGFEHREPRGAVAQAGDIGEVRAARGLILFLAADREFLERFEAIGRKAGGEDRYAFAFAAEPREHRVGRGFEPFGAPESSRAVFWHWQ